MMDQAARQEVSSLASEAVEHRGAQQNPAELAELGQLLVERFEPGAPMLEVGTYAGGTAWFLDQLGFGVTAVDIDLSHLKDPPTGVTFVQADSSQWAARCAERFAFVLIDGDHLYEGVRRDWRAFAPLVRAGGLLAFHDIAEHYPPQASSVHLLWAEIGTNKREIVHPPWGWGGFGLVEL